MTRRMVAIGVIFLAVSFGWFLLAENMDRRTFDQDAKLEPAVGRLWGARQNQQAPRVTYLEERFRSVEHRVGDHRYTERVSEPQSQVLPLQASDIDVALALEHRRKGLLWFATYRVRFHGTYRLINTTGIEREVFFEFPLPASGAVYDDFLVLVGDKPLDDIPMEEDRVRLSFKLSPAAERVVTVAYQSQGLDSWLYRFGSDVSQVKNFQLQLKTDFDRIDFPDRSLSPTAKELLDDGWRLSWDYTNLLSGVEIGMLLPSRLNPGPWVSRVTTFAPISLLFFFFLLFIFTTVRAIPIHPMNYFFLGAAFFAFHLLLAYLVDHISIHIAFWISAAVSIGLVVSYMRLVVDSRFALLEVGISQLIYLVGFAYTFFFEGATGLAVAILSVIVLFVIMQYTGRLDWEKVFREAAPGARPSAQEGKP